MKYYNELTDSEREEALEAIKVYGGALFEFNMVMGRIMNGEDYEDASSVAEIMFESGLEQVRQDIINRVSKEELEARQTISL